MTVVCFDKTKNLAAEGDARPLSIKMREKSNLKKDVMVGHKKRRIFVCVGNCG